VRERLEAHVIHNRKEDAMNRLPTFILSATALALTASWALAQTAPPSFQADPDVYKVIFGDQNFRVIAVTRKKGVHDKPNHLSRHALWNVFQTNAKT
jgi:hypothetical protein